MNRRAFVSKLATVALVVGLGRYFPALAQANNAKPLPSEMQLNISFSINQPSGGGRYHKPYVAVWIENDKGETVKTISLWAMQAPKGKKWLSELRKWYSPTNAAEVKSSATRQPGKYTVTWDGLDEQGKRASQGEYTIYIESAREKGPYGRVRMLLNLESIDSVAKAEDEGDLGGIVAEYKAK